MELGIKIVLKQRTHRGSKFIGNNSGYDLTSLIESGDWSKRVHKPIYCQRGWHYWSPKCKNIWHEVSEFAGPRDHWDRKLRAFLVEAKGTVIRENSSQNKKVAQSIRFIRPLTRKEVNRILDCLTAEEKCAILNQWYESWQPVI